MEVFSVYKYLHPSSQLRGGKSTMSETNTPPQSTGFPWFRLAYIVRLCSFRGQRPAPKRTSIQQFFLSHQVDDRFHLGSQFPWWQHLSTWYNNTLLDCGPRRSWLLTPDSDASALIFTGNLAQTTPLPATGTQDWVHQDHHWDDSTPA